MRMIIIGLAAWIFALPGHAQDFDRTCRDLALFAAVVEATTVQGSAMQISDDETWLAGAIATLRVGFRNGYPNRMVPAERLLSYRSCD